MLLEGRVLIRAFVEAHRILNEYTLFQGNKMYRNLIGATVEEFRNVVAQFEACLDSEEVSYKCPAYPVDNPIVAMDANFGLVRKTSSGKSFERSNHPAQFFLSNEDEAQFLGSYSDTASIPQNCNSFKAGDAIRSQRKPKKLDEKGVFGVICRHEIPLLFLNMTGGERLAYSVLVIKHMLQQNAHLHVTCDIACKLEAHLKKNNNPILEQITLAITVFHCYGHKQSCQRRRGKERLWAYLIKFASITKEMTPCHRESLLNDALQHCSHRKLEVLDQT